MLSRQSLEILLDLIEIKLDAMIIQDRDDMKIARQMRTCRNEILKEIQERHKRKHCPVIDMSVK